MWYFAYGSNLNQDDLDKWCDRHGRPRLDLKSKTWHRATLHDFAFGFDCYSRTRRCGAANIQPSPGECVKGVVFEITQPEFELIAQKEGTPKTYVEKNVGLELEDGTRVPAKTFHCCPGTERPDLKPSKEYLRVIVEGDRRYGLDSAWIEKLEQIPTK
jgi:cation transport regulator ChaC